LGFTLVELLLVLVIAAMVAAVAPPLLSAAMPGLQLKSTAREMAAALRYARGQAIAGQQEGMVNLDLEERRFAVTGRSNDYAIPDGIAVLLDTVRSELHGERGGAIRFYPDGSSTGGRVTLSRGESSYKVDVDWLTGRVRILD
jgi:general secretion pathway protein H